MISGERKETAKLSIFRKQGKWKEVEKKKIYLHCQIGTDGEIQGEINIKDWKPSNSSCQLSKIQYNRKI